MYGIMTKISSVSSQNQLLMLKHRHARRARVIFYEVSEIGAFMELFTVMIWLILEIVLVVMYSKI